MFWKNTSLLASDRLLDRIAFLLDLEHERLLSDPTLSHGEIARHVVALFEAAVAEAVFNHVVAADRLDDEPFGHA